MGSVLIIARLSSARLPGKALLQLREGLTVLEQVIIQAQGSGMDVALLHDEESATDRVRGIAKSYNIEYYEGSNNPTKRIYDYILRSGYNKEYLIRVTADNPCVSFEAMRDWKQEADVSIRPCDYLCFPGLMPGTRPEIFKTKTVLRLIEDVRSRSGFIGEHLTLYFTQNKNVDKSIGRLAIQNSDLLRRSLTIDTYTQHLCVSGCIADWREKLIPLSFIDTLNAKELPLHTPQDSRRYPDINRYRIET